jgi:hypothetical protein
MRSNRKCGNRLKIKKLCFIRLWLLGECVGIFDTSTDKHRPFTAFDHGTLHVDAGNFAIAFPSSTWVKSDAHSTEIIGGNLDCDGGSFKNPSAIGVTLAYWTERSVEQRLSAIGELIEPDSDRILEQCEAHQATAGRNYLPFLNPVHLTVNGQPAQPRSQCGNPTRILTVGDSATNGCVN